MGPEDPSEDAEVGPEAAGRQVDRMEAGAVMEARAAARVEEVEGLGAGAAAARTTRGSHSQTPLDWRHEDGA